MVTKYNVVGRMTTFKEGDLVDYWVKVLRSKRKCISTKLELRWPKPMEMANF